MTSPAENAVCIRCGERKPADQFPRHARTHSGLNSWCRECFREYSRQYAELHPAKSASPYSHQASQHLADGKTLDYSRAVCDHVAWYVQRKITEFEATHHIEAPPHLTAILSVAKSISDQHPRAEPNTNGKGAVWDLRCVRCAELFTARAPNAEYCDTCRVIRRQEKRKTYRQTPAGRTQRLLEQQRRNARSRQCTVCGGSMIGGSKRKYCDACLHKRQVDRAAALRKAFPQIEAACKDCGTTIVRRNSAQKYCTECRRERDRAGRRAWKAKHRANPHGYAIFGQDPG